MVLLFAYNEGKMGFLTKIKFLNEIKANSVCSHFSPKHSLIKTFIKIRSSLTRSQSKKYETCLP